MKQDFEEIILHLARIADSLEQMAMAAKEYTDMLKNEGAVLHKEFVKVVEPVDQESHLKLREVLLARMKEYQKHTAARSSGRLGMGDYQMRVGMLTQQVNEMMGLEPNTIKAQRVGYILRNMKQVRVSARMNDGYRVYWNVGDLEGKEG